MGFSIALYGYYGDLFRRFINNYWHEVGMQFDDCGTKLVENFTSGDDFLVGITYMSEAEMSSDACLCVN